MTDQQERIRAREISLRIQEQKNIRLYTIPAAIFTSFMVGIAPLLAARFFPNSDPLRARYAITGISLVIPLLIIVPLLIRVERRVKRKARELEAND
jgi:hypothetical protein